MRETEVLIDRKHKREANKLFLFTKHWLLEAYHNTAFSRIDKKEFKRFTAELGFPSKNPKKLYSELTKNILKNLRKGGDIEYARLCTESICRILRKFSGAEINEQVSKLENAAAEMAQLKKKILRNDTGGSRRRPGSRDGDSHMAVNVIEAVVGFFRLFFDR